MSDSQQQRTKSTIRVGLFPLPNVVLFPHAVLPLHIFEERYKSMTADTLAGDRRIAMALYLSGWQRDYYGHAPIDPVVCLGTILSSERLHDGRFNFLLRGDHRARILRELPPCETAAGDSAAKPYRIADLEILDETPALEIDLESHRAKLSRLFNTGPIATTRLGRQFTQLLTTTAPTANIADLIAFSFFEDPQLKQSLLADADPVHRIQHLIESLCPILPMLSVRLQHAHGAVSMN